MYPDSGHALSDVLPHFYAAMEAYLAEDKCFAPVPKFDFGEAHSAYSD